MNKERYKMSYLYNSLTKSELKLQRKSNSTKVIIKYNISRELVDSLSLKMLKMLRHDLINKMK